MRASLSGWSRRREKIFPAPIIGRPAVSSASKQTVLICVLAVFFAASAPTDAHVAAEEKTTSSATTITVAYLTKRYPEPPPLSLVDKILSDKGLPGARVAIEELKTIGRLIGEKFQLKEVILPEDGDIEKAANELFEAGNFLIVADLVAADLLKVADLAPAKNAIILNMRDSADALRQADCRANLFHVVPSFAMRADAISQYLVWKRWKRWFLVRGKKPEDLDYARAIKRSAKRYGGRIVEERAYEFVAGHRRVDSGHQQIQTQMPNLTQNAPEHDVIFVSDAAEAFGDYILYRSARPRPVVGSHGLRALAWHSSFEQFAGMQMQSRFEKFAGRKMIERDYTAWLSVRIFGEALIRTKKKDPKVLRTYMLSDKFKVAGFKGRGMTFRSWSGQLRQPVLLIWARGLISVSPQEGFLHKTHYTDTLGFDRPDSRCPLRQERR